MQFYHANKKDSSIAWYSGIYRKWNVVITVECEVRTNETINIQNRRHYAVILTTRCICTSGNLLHEFGQLWQPFCPIACVTWRFFLALFYGIIWTLNKKRKKKSDIRGYSCQNVCFLHLIYVAEVVALRTYLEIKHFFFYLEWNWPRLTDHCNLRLQFNAI